MTCQSCPKSPKSAICPQILPTQVWETFPKLSRWGDTWKLTQKNVIFSRKPSFLQGLPVGEIGSEIPTRIPWKTLFPVSWFLGKMWEFVAKDLVAYFKPVPNPSQIRPGRVWDGFGTGLKYQDLEGLITPRDSIGCANPSLYVCGASALLVRSQNDNWLLFW